LIPIAGPCDLESKYLPAPAQEPIKQRAWRVVVEFHREARSQEGPAKRGGAASGGSSKRRALPIPVWPRPVRILPRGTGSRWPPVVPRSPPQIRAGFRPTRAVALSAEPRYCKRVATRGPGTALALEWSASLARHSAARHHPTPSTGGALGLPTRHPSPSSVVNRARSSIAGERFQLWSSC
jgi:hypothetical protein